MTTRKRGRIARTARPRRPRKRKRKRKISSSKSLAVATEDVAVADPSVPNAPNVIQLVISTIVIVKIANLDKMVKIAQSARNVRRNSNAVSVAIVRVVAEELVVRLGVDAASLVAVVDRPDHRGAKRKGNVEMMTGSRCPPGTTTCKTPRKMRR
jgi:hypothetical protein